MADDAKYLVGWENFVLESVRQPPNIVRTDAIWDKLSAHITASSPANSSCNADPGSSGPGAEANVDPTAGILADSGTVARAS